MDDTVIAKHLENLDHRLENVERILPTLATKDELKTLATKAELVAVIAGLATKEELQAAIAPLATKAELRATEAALRGEIRDAAEESRRHMSMLIEHQDTKLQLLAEHVLSLTDKLR
jgi:hypothetical protein